MEILGVNKGISTAFLVIQSFLLHGYTTVGLTSFLDIQPVSDFFHRNNTLLYTSLQLNLAYVLISSRSLPRNVTYFYFIVSGYILNYLCKLL